MSIKEQIPMSKADWLGATLWMSTVFVIVSLLVFKNYKLEQQLHEHREYIKARDIKWEKKFDDGYKEIIARLDTLEKKMTV